VDQQKAVLDSEDLAETQVDLRWRERPGENQIMSSENGERNGRALGKMRVYSVIPVQ
jgi:hypothetical protein